MKKLIYTILSLLAAGQMTQAQRVVLIEEVTSASCGPCAAANPGFNNLLSNNVGDVAVVKYQRGGGNYIDPMWSFNSTEVDGRIASYYGVNSFPNVWVDGTLVASPNNVTQSVIDNANALTQTYDIELTHELSGNTDTLYVEATFVAMKDFQDASDVLLKAFVVIVEKEITYNSAPGTNGEKEFSNVMRKMYPNQNGKTIGQQTSGDTVRLSYSYIIDKNTIDPAELAAVAFVQSSPTKEVFQAAVSVEKLVLSIRDEVNAKVAEDVVSIYPSPANNELFIQKRESNVNGAVKIYNSLGEVIETFNLSQSVHKVTTSDFASGLYFFGFTEVGGSKTITKKFIVNH